MKTPENPSSESTPERSALDLSPEIAATNTAYRQINKLGHFAFRYTMTEKLVAIADYAEGEVENKHIQQLEMNTAEVLNSFDIEALSPDQKDIMYALFTDALKEVGEDTDKLRALNTLFVMYQIAKTNRRYKDLDISRQISLIVTKPPMYPPLRIVPDEE